MLAGFRNAYVFDVSQTEGAELPTIREISGDVGENRERLFAFVERQGIELSFSESIAPALGMSYGGKIALLPGQSKAEEFSTLVHELAHELLHRPSGVRPPRKSCARPRPKPLPSSSARPWDSKPEPLR